MWAEAGERLSLVVNLVHELKHCFPWECGSEDPMASILLREKMESRSKEQKQGTCLFSSTVLHLALCSWVPPPMPSGAQQESETQEDVVEAPEADPNPRKTPLT